MTRLRRATPDGRASRGSLGFDGEIDAWSVAVVRASCLDLVDGCDLVEVDLGQVTVFTAAGVRFVERLADRMAERGGVLVVAATSDIVDRVSRVLHLDGSWPARRGELSPVRVGGARGDEVPGGGAIVGATTACAGSAPGRDASRRGRA
ncbi:STAS domain-containing protein [Ilumatobacter sp.]|uniref:STAS domain-containing protein n=1 Tax=Ilumatobacter sp. TaxID=1967498 RepID=UPI003B5185CA